MAGEEDDSDSAVGARSDCVLAETEQLGDLVNSESVFEASHVSEKGAGHQGPAEAGGRPRPLWRQ